MGRTRTSGITTDNQGNRIINKQFRGETIYARLGVVSQEEAETWLARCIEERRRQLELGVRPRRNFCDAAEKYLNAVRHKRSVEDIAWHVRMLLPWIGTLPLQGIHDGSLEAFVSHRRASGVSPTTINRSLEVVRRILILAARSWRHENGLPWLDTAPLITMLEERRRRPYPLTWEEQRRLLPMLPPHLVRMVLFALNTGCREQEICRLRWDWEVRVPEIGRSVFLIPGDFAKNGEDRLVVLNDVAWRIVQECRGTHVEFVFTWKKGVKGRPRPIGSINNTAWQLARARAGIPARIHDLRHTFGRRLRAAGVGLEDREDLLGHKTRRITSHYSAAEIGQLLEAANRAIESPSTPTVLRLAQTKGLAKVGQEQRQAG